MTAWDISGGAPRPLAPHLPLVEEVGQVLHGIAADTGDVLVLPGMGCSQRLDPVADVIRDLHSNLQAQH